MNKLIHVRMLSAAQGEPGNYYFRPRALCDKHKVGELQWKITEELLQHLMKEKSDVIKHLAGIEDKVS